MSDAYRIGFPDFAAKATAKHSSVLEAATEYFGLAAELLGPPTTTEFISLLRSVCLTISNSFQSVLLLTMNGCGTDALKIARSIFESSVSVGYIQKNPALAADFIDYRWVKRHKHQEFLAQYAPAQLTALSPAEVAKTVAEYGRVKNKFKGRKSWSDKDLRQMAKDIGIEQSYLGIYPFTSSVHHLDVIGVMAQEDENLFDIEVLPSEKNIGIALSISGLGAYVSLASFDEAAKLGKETVLADWLFKKYKTALTSQ